MPMPRISHRLNPWALLVPSVLILVVVLAAAAWARGGAKPVVFILGVGAAVILVIACAVVLEARVGVAEARAERAEALAGLAVEEVGALRVQDAHMRDELAELKERVIRHVALCPSVPPDLAATFRKLRSV